MNKAIEELISLIKDREHHLLIVSGNVYDLIPPDKKLNQESRKTFENLEEYLISLTKKKFPQCLTYDLFSGIQVIRGEERKIEKLMGLGQEESGKNADLMNALKKAKMGNSQFPVNPLEAFPCFDQLLKNQDSKPTLLIFDYTDAIVPQQIQNSGSQVQKVAAIAFTKWSRSTSIRRKGHLIVILSRQASDLDESVLDRTFQGTQLRLPKPDESERKEFLTDHQLPEELANPLSKITAGLSFLELEKISHRVASEKNPDLVMKEVFAMKQKVLRDEYGDLMEIMEARNGFETIGGLEKPIEKLREIASAMRQGNITLAPQGMLFMGPPGTGKTVLAEAFAKEAGLNFVKPLDIKSMWLGQSERRMSKFIYAIKDLSPVVVFIDEFDQNQGQRGGFDGDSGTSRSLFKKMLEVMSDTSLRGKILWILATNRSDLIDPAMKRPGRCDLRIPFLPPDEKQLALICEAAFRQYPDMKSGVKDWMPYAKRCQGYTGADIIEMIRRAWEHAVKNGREAVSDEDMEWGHDDYRLPVVDKKTVAVMTLLALLECSSNDLMPSGWKKIGEDFAKELESIDSEEIKIILKKFSELKK